MRSRMCTYAELCESGSELPAPLVQEHELLLELGRELLEPRAPRIHELELPACDLRRTLEDRDTLLVGRVAVPLVAQRRASLFGLGQSDELLERQAEQVAEPDELAQPGDVGLRVVAVSALAARGTTCEQAKLLVV